MPLDFSRIYSTILAESGNYFPVFISLVLTILRIYDILSAWIEQLFYTCIPRQSKSAS